MAVESDSPMSGHVVCEFKTESGIEILTLYFRTAQGSISNRSTTFSTNLLHVIDPQPELLEQISELYSEAAAMLRRSMQQQEEPKCEHLLTEFGCCLGCGERVYR